MNTMPARMPNMRILSAMSPFRMWLNSCAITPCNSSRFSASSVPRVTTTAALDTVLPAAKALIARSPSITNTAGTRTPDAMDISSTTFIKRCSSRSPECGLTRRAPTIFATAAPPALSFSVCTRLAPRITARVANAPST